MVDVSIIIINYNSFDLLSDCLATLFEHTKGISFEVIVVDNGSTLPGLEEVKSRFPSVKYITNETGMGFASANNIGIKNASGRYILMLNNDILFIEDALSKIVGYSNLLGNNAVIGCKLLNRDLSYQVSVVDFDGLINLIGETFFLYKLFPRNRFLSKYHLNNPYQTEPMEVEAVKGAFLFAPKKIFDTLNNLDERFFFYYEETDFCCRWKKTGGKIIYYPGAKIIHLGGASTDSDHWFKYKFQHLSKIQFFQKHFNGIKFLLAVILQYAALIIRFPLYFIIGLLKRDSALIRKSGYYLRSIFLFPSGNNGGIS